MLHVLHKLMHKLMQNCTCELLWVCLLDRGLFSGRPPEGIASSLV